MIGATCSWPKRQLLAILCDDWMRTLQKSLGLLPAELRAKVVGVCMDMKTGYRRVVERPLPNVVVADHFRVIQDANR